MAYGDNRSSVATDTFDTSISASWTQGPDTYADLAWVTGGHVEPATNAATNCMVRNAESFADDQYCKITVNTLSAADGNLLGAACRASTTQETTYAGLVTSASGLTPSAKYTIFEADAAATFTELAATGTYGALAAGDTITLEAEGTTLRLGTSEGGGADTQRLTTTDATIASGQSSVFAVALSTTSRARLTAWEGGDIGAGGGTSVRYKYLTLLGVS